MTDSEAKWFSAPKGLILREDEVHVWRASLDLNPSRLLSLKHILSPDEIKRAERFSFEIDSHRFIAARGMLRSILGLYLKIEPRKIVFRYSSYGKPSLAKGLSEDEIHFNIAHSHGLALFAFTLKREIGVDLEKIRSNLAYGQIADRFFSELESSMLRTLPSTERLIAFYNCWTRKEAYIKANGKGLFNSLKQFDVSLIPGEKARLLTTRDNTKEAARWSFEELTPAPGYIGALAVEGHNWQLRCWQLEQHTRS